MDLPRMRELAYPNRPSHSHLRQDANPSAHKWAKVLALKSPRDRGTSRWVVIHRP